MKGTGLFYIGILIVLLIAIPSSVQLGRAQHDNDLKNLMNERDQLLSMVQGVKINRDQLKVQQATVVAERDTAVNQRDMATSERDALTKQLETLKSQLSEMQVTLGDEIQKNNELQNQVVSLQEQINQKAQALEDANAQVAAKQDEIKSLNDKVAMLQIQVKVLEDKYLGLQQESIRISPRPDLTGKVGVFLAVMIGIATLSSGGYLYYRFDPSRNCPENMTGDQLKQNAQYQR